MGLLLYEQSELGPDCLPISIAVLKFVTMIAKICNRRLKQTAFLDEICACALRPNDEYDMYIENRTSFCKFWTECLLFETTNALKLDQ